MSLHPGRIFAAVLCTFCWTLPSFAAPRIENSPKLNAALEEEAIRNLVEKIDRLCEKYWHDNNVIPAPAAADEEFLRRASLDLVGVIPSVAEVYAFCADESKDKRARKIAQLVKRPGFAQHLATVYRQEWLPQADANIQFQFPGSLFEQWLRTRLEENARLDTIVREILTAPTLFDPRGRGRDDERFKPNPSGFIVVNEYKPESAASAAARLFMGVKIECAQCHNHPFDEYTREQFWQTAAFFSDLQPTIANLSDDQAKRRIKIIDADPKKQKTVQAVYLNKTEPDWKPGVSPRKVFADWLTAKENPYFAKNTVNRTWAYFLGRGFVDPLEDSSPENLPSIPELYTELTHSFAASGYNLKVLIQAITRSKVYQLSSKLTEPSQANPKLFGRMLVRSLSGEQLYDSLAVASGFNARSYIPGTVGRDEFLKRFTSRKRAVGRQTSILQALELMNGNTTAGQSNPKSGRFLSGIADAPFYANPKKIEVLFLATLSRPPTASEAARFESYVGAGPTSKKQQEALGDVIWALLNSSEFATNH